MADAAEKLDYEGYESLIFEAIDETIEWALSDGLNLDLSSLWTLGDPEKNLSEQPGIVSDEFLPYLAWALSVELWPRDDLVSQEEKRKLVKTWTKVRKLRGTKEALRLAYEAIGVEGEITENPDGELFTLRVAFSSDKKVITRELQTTVDRLTRLIKPVRVRFGLEIKIDTISKAETSCVGILQPMISVYGGRPWPF